jgi:hypothetical protein
MDRIILPVEDAGKVSDGYHTFNELYEHIHILFILLIRIMPQKTFRSRVHHDGTIFKGLFIAGIETKYGPVVQHLPLRLWSRLDHGDIRTLPKAPFDWRTSDDALKNLAELAADTQLEKLINGLSPK